MSLSCLRPDLPAPSSFTVTELPHRAKLDQNEAPGDLPEPLKRAITADVAAGAWNRYPQPVAYREAKAALAAAIGVAPEAVALTVGADQVIQLSFLLAAGPGRRARWFEPTYPFIAHTSRVTGTIGEGVTLGPDVDARIDPAAVIAAPAPHLVVLVAPNNPTGGVPARAAFDAALADDGRLVLVDEAYADFAGETMIREAPAHRNLLVARSLSKSLAAAVRLGFAVGHPELVAALERVITAPYHLNALQLAVAARYAEILPHVEAAAAAVRAERDRVANTLAALRGVTPRAGRANFVLFGVDAAAEVHRRLAAAGVRVRDVSGLPGLSSHLRVTIGTREENDLFLAELGRALDA